MRDPERIDEVLDALREAWMRNPDARLGQLVYNAAYAGTVIKYIEQNKSLPVPISEFDTFYVEDDTLLRGLYL